MKSYSLDFDDDDGIFNTSFEDETEVSNTAVNASLISYFSSLSTNRNYFDFVFVDNLLNLAGKNRNPLERTIVSDQNTVLLNWIDVFHIVELWSNDYSAEL